MHCFAIWRVALTRALASSSAPPPERDQAAHDEADHRSAHGEFSPVLADLPLDVGYLNPAVPQRIDGTRELVHPTNVCPPA